MINTKQLHRVSEHSLALVRLAEVIPLELSCTLVLYVNIGVSTDGCVSGVSAHLSAGTSKH